MYSPLPCTHVFARAIVLASPTSFCLRCATNSAGMSRQRLRPSDMTESAKPAPPCVFVIFGAAGDLTRRLLMPALYNLRRGKLLSDDFRIIGVARGEKSNEAFRHDFDA